jgi:16S rRNA (guanine527-N7)-methyltransferase
MDVLRQACEAFGLTLSDVQLAQFDQYLELLLEWNSRINLTAIREPEAIRLRHFADSLSCLAATGELEGQRLADVGTGAGFPGLVLKICFPDMQLTLVESVGKKCRFLEEVVSRLTLQTVEILQERVEVVGRLPAHRERYDWAVARAVTQMPALVEYLLPLCRVGGSMLAQKGSSAAEETENAAWAIKQLGGDAAQVLQVSVPGEEASRFLVTVKKVRPTPSKYPRRTGVPTKQPLSR